MLILLNIILVFYDWFELFSEFDRSCYILILCYFLNWPFFRRLVEWSVKVTLYRLLLFIILFIFLHYCLYHFSHISALWCVKAWLPGYNYVLVLLQESSSKSNIILICHFFVLGRAVPNGFWLFRSMCLKGLILMLFRRFSIHWLNIHLCLSWYLIRP